MNERLRAAFKPPAALERADTGLVFTDILFGFVIFELFQRLAKWLQLPWYIRWHLIAGAVLVLGSWIGFRRSRNRTLYEVKFFNVPLFRFLIDQVMLVLYFRTTVLTPMERNAEPLSPGDLASSTTVLLVLVFLLYCCWDLLGIWIAKVKTADELGNRKPKYPAVNENEKQTEKEQRADWAGLLISTVSLALLGGLWWFTEVASLNESNASWCLVIATVLLLAYRWAKEVRTSWRSLLPAA